MSDDRVFDAHDPSMEEIRLDRMENCLEIGLIFMLESEVQRWTSYFEASESESTRHRFPAIQRAMMDIAVRREGSYGKGCLMDLDHHFIQKLTGPMMRGYPPVLTNEEVQAAERYREGTCSIVP